MTTKANTFMAITDYHAYKSKWFTMHYMLSCTQKQMIYYALQPVMYPKAV